MAQDSSNTSIWVAKSSFADDLQAADEHHVHTIHFKPANTAHLIGSSNSGNSSAREKEPCADKLHKQQSRLAGALTNQFITKVHSIIKSRGGGYDTVDECKQACRVFVCFTQTHLLQQFLEQMALSCEPLHGSRFILNHPPCTWPLGSKL